MLQYLLHLALLRSDVTAIPLLKTAALQRHTEEAQWRLGLRTEAVFAAL